MLALRRDGPGHSSGRITAWPPVVMGRTSSSWSFYRRLGDWLFAVKNGSYLYQYFVFFASGELA